MSKKYIAEFIGTFGLALVVLIAVASTAAPVAVPIITGLTLALFVYTIGHSSGCHVNPAVTVGIWSIKKISSLDALYYIISQVLGALLALTVAGYFGITSPMTGGDFSIAMFLAEALGTFFFTFGIASVVYGHAKDQMAGIIIGGSLTFGVLISALLGAAGILNPAVALALNSMTILYIAAPIVGSLAGFHTYKAIR